MATSHKLQRSSIRLKDYDYTSAGAYFISLVAHTGACLFGDISNEQMSLNPFGEIIQDEWLCTPHIRPEIHLDEFVIMPNHLHGIIIITETDIVGEHGNVPFVGAHDTSFTVGAHGRAPLPRPPKSLGSFVAGYKSIVTKRTNIIRATPGTPIWQRNYYEHIIRDDQDLNRIRVYIHNNPLQWETDTEYLTP